MKTVDRIGKIVNWIVLAYLIGITILSWIGKITYGYGLGDLFYVFPSSALTLVHLIVILALIYRKREKAEKGLALLVGIIFLLIAVWFTYEFTIGRGVEYKWNGKVFYGKNKIEEKLQALTLSTPVTGPPQRRAKS